MRVILPVPMVPGKIESSNPIEERLYMCDPSKRSLNIYNIGTAIRFIVFYGITVNGRRLNGS